MLLSRLHQQHTARYCIAVTVPATGHGFGMQVEMCGMRLFLADLLFMQTENFMFSFVSLCLSSPGLLCRPINVDVSALLLARASAFAEKMLHFHFLLVFCLSFQYYHKDFRSNNQLDNQLDNPRYFTPKLCSLLPCYVKARRILLTQDLWCNLPPTRLSNCSNQRSFQLRYSPRMHSSLQKLFILLTQRI